MFILPLPHARTQCRRSVFSDGPTFPETSADITNTVLTADLRSAHPFAIQPFNGVKRL